MHYVWISINWNDVFDDDRDWIWMEDAAADRDQNSMATESAVTVLRWIKDYAEDSGPN